MGLRPDMNTNKTTETTMKKSNWMMLALTAIAIGAAITAMTGCNRSETATDTNTPGSSTNAVTKSYPLDYCLVSGDKLGGMGKPISIVYKGQEIKFCCGDCPADFKKDPEKYMKKLAEAEAKLPKAKK